VSIAKDLGAWALVDAAGLDANEAILDNIDATNAMGTANLVEIQVDGEGVTQV
jgi:hypothetical protein